MKAVGVREPHFHTSYSAWNALIGVPASLAFPIAFVQEMPDAEKSADNREAELVTKDFDLRSREAATVAVTPSKNRTKWVDL